MYVNTVSGLHGHLIDFVSFNPESYSAVLNGAAIIRRDDAPFESARFSTHLLFEGPDGRQLAESGNYDLTIDEARADLAQRASRSAMARGV